MYLIIIAYSRLPSYTILGRLALLVLVITFIVNVFHHRAAQPIELPKKAWQHQLILRIFNFIAIKQGACVRCAYIRFRRYLCILFACSSVMPSPAAVPTAP